VKFLTSLRSERLVADIKANSDPASPLRKKAIQKLIHLGANVITPVIDALDEADRSEAAAYSEVLASLCDAKSFPKILKGLAAPNPTVVKAVAQALAKSQQYPANLLISALKDHSLSSVALLDIIGAHKNRIPVRDLLSAAYGNDAGDKNALFKIINQVVDESALPDLLPRLEGKDLGIRVQLMAIVSRFGTVDVQNALLKQVKDPNKLIRQAALMGLSKQPPLSNIAPIVGLLADADIEVANRAVELLIKAAHPDTMQYLIVALQDESEYARRAAVEVLNELGDVHAIKYLFSAIKDSDWWVRSRAADALGKIGGPRVIDAVLELVRDQDEDVRRAAIEILNQTKDERAVDSLLKATEDDDWWVSERAVDALADMGAVRAVPRLLEMLNGHVRALPTTLRAIGRLGSPSHIAVLLPLLERTETESVLATITTLGQLTDSTQMNAVLTALRALSESSNEADIVSSARTTLSELEARLADTAATSRVATLGQISIDDSANVRALLAKKTSHSRRMDVSTLRVGDVLGDRYRYIEKIGKGAFGTVLLMHDQAVDEQLVLKFLNPNVADDEEIMRRFVHELRYSRKITHPNVIRIYDFLNIRGNYAISMEYFKSHTLAQEIRQGAPMPISQAIRFGVDITSGMGVAHDVGIIHRDLKPANVLINDKGVLKIVDFGVSSAVWEGEAHLTRAGYVIGSPKYMAPEQILGKDTDPRADIYSTGVMLYEMLTGQPPYSRGDHMAVMYQHVQGKAPTPIELRPELPAALSDLVIKAMSVEREERFDSMDSLRLALEPFL
jgi:eukaryotic-like serine/threonine-protein kinase